MSIRWVFFFFFDRVRVLAIGRNPIRVLLIRSDPVRVLSVRSDAIRSGPILVLLTPFKRRDEEGYGPGDEMEATQASGTRLR